MQTRRLPIILPTVLFLALGLFALTAVVAIDNATAKATKALNQITLTPAAAYPGVTGKAKWESSGGGRELEVEIEHATALKGKTLTVKIGGKVWGKMKVSNLGRARIVRRTEAGQTVPTSVAGKKVTVKTASGALVASGKFH